MRQPEEIELSEIRRVLRNMADHLSELAGEVTDVSEVVSAMLTIGSSAPSETDIRELQKMDRLEQSLDDLARLSHGLATDGLGLQDMLTSLRLSATQRILQDTTAVPDTQAGHVELF
ncbi:hypothetical protein [uncultured Tateyamaria sp.]|uniref:hypothetical protein n=1 Tax=uncultured Tateyamaria sp. TaxID=455651 RepID=UPI0026282191|nr:hypothetical protein [uncultured Tateyamaria sp.]